MSTGQVEFRPLNGAATGLDVESYKHSTPYGVGVDSWVCTAVVGDVASWRTVDDWVTMLLV